MIPYLRIETLTNHTLSGGTYGISPPPSPLRDSSSPKLTKCFQLNGGNLTDGMTPGFKQFTVNILVIKIISLHSDAKTAVDWAQLSFGNKRPFGGFAKNQLENNRQTRYQSHYICELQPARRPFKPCLQRNSHLLKSKHLMFKVC